MHDEAFGSWQCRSRAEEVQQKEEWQIAATRSASVLGGTVTNDAQSDGLLKMAAHYLNRDAQKSVISAGMVTSAPPMTLLKNLATEYPALPRVIV